MRTKHSKPSFIYHHEERSKNLTKWTNIDKKTYQTLSGRSYVGVFFLWSFFFDIDWIFMSFSTFSLANSFLSLLPSIFWKHQTDRAILWHQETASKSDQMIQKHFRRKHTKTTTMKNLTSSTVTCRIHQDNDRQREKRWAARNGRSCFQKHCERTTH